MQRLSTSALIFHDPSTAADVMPIVRALQSAGWLAGELPKQDFLTDQWREEVRRLLDSTTVGVFVVSNRALLSPTCRWILGALSDRAIPVVLLFAEPIQLVDLHRKLKFRNIDWTKSQSLRAGNLSGAKARSRLLEFLTPVGSRKRAASRSRNVKFTSG